MKVAILTPTFSHFSGIDRVVEGQAEDFAKKGHQVTVIAFESTIEPKGYELKLLGMPKNQFWQRLYRLFFFLDVKKVNGGAKMLEGFDTAISHFYPMNIIAEKAREKYGVKYLAWNPGVCFPYLYGNFLERTYMKIFNYYTNKTLKKADKIYSISKFLAAELKKETGIDSMVSYIKVDKERFNPRIRGEKIRNKYGIKKEKVVLFVGRLSPHKGVHYLIDAFRIARKSKSNVKLLIVGKPTFDGYYSKLKQSADKDIIFAGFVDDKELPEYYAACDIYATCSLWEGFDLPAVEAQHAGKPAVAFDAGSHKEVVKKGKLVKTGDVEGFANALLEYIG